MKLETSQGTIENSSLIAACILIARMSCSLNCLLFFLIRYFFVLSLA